MKKFWSFTKKIQIIYDIMRHCAIVSWFIDSKAKKKNHLTELYLQGFRIIRNNCIYIKSLITKKKNRKWQILINNFKISVSTTLPHLDMYYVQITIIITKILYNGIIISVIRFLFPILLPVLRNVISTNITGFNLIPEETLFIKVKAIFLVEKCLTERKKHIHIHTHIVVKPIGIYEYFAVHRI